MSLPDDQADPAWSFFNNQVVVAGVVPVVYFICLGKFIFLIQVN